MLSKNNIVEPEFTPVSDLPADAAFEDTPVTDDALLDALLNTEDEVTKQVYISRFNAFFTVKSVTSDEYNRLEKRCKYPVRNNRTKQLEEKTDQDKLSYLLIAMACVSPDFSNPKLLSKYNTTDPAVVIKKRLLIGEVTELTQAVMDVSGFADGVEIVKNSSSEAEKLE